jgi:hypothetical protein
MILNTPTVAEITVFIQNSIVIDFETQGATIAWAVKIEVLSE